MSVDSQGVHRQYTTVLCLVCETSTYRIGAEVAPDTDAKEGPILPSDDWTERETLLSRNGWVLVNVGAGGCIVSRLPHVAVLHDFVIIAHVPSFAAFDAFRRVYLVR